MVSPAGGPRAWAAGLWRVRAAVVFVLAALLVLTRASPAQVAPSPAERTAYTGLLAAAARGDALADREGRTPRALAQGRGYEGMVLLLERAGAR